METSLESMQDFPLRMGALPQGALQFAAFMDAEPADAAEVTELAGWLFGKGLFPVLDGVDTELLGDEVRCTLLTACTHYKQHLRRCLEKCSILLTAQVSWQNMDAISHLGLHDICLHASHRVSVLLSHPAVD